ncbi:MAG TPA: hypothetical protein VNR60_07065 [Croceibacterium sp.]|nr:hypothetical protein [Croceibacterium sp.]
MNRRLRNGSKVAFAVLAGALVASPALTQQQSTPPIARYTIDAGTTSGMMAMASGGGVGAALNMMRGGNQVAHELVLRLGSSRSATGEPKADHFMPGGARLGASVPLLSPQPTRPSQWDDQGPEHRNPQQLPEGRLLLFWGCGEKAGPGQPVIIDFSRLARGEIPPGLYAQGLNLPDDWSVTSGNSTTYGDWPNSRDSQTVPANSSLLGAHRIAGNYSPEINFTLADDFMPALQATGRAQPSGALALSWGALPKATGYYAWAIGAGGGRNSRDMVWWTSSSTQQFGGPMSDWISPSTAARLVQAGTVMAPSQTSCTIPAEARAAGGEAMMTQLYAYGPQADFVYPPRPSNPRVAWNPEWTARVRFRASTMIIPGMEGMGQQSGRGTQQATEEQAPASGKPKCRSGLRGMAERAAGLCE